MARLLLWLYPLIIVVTFIKTSWRGASCFLHHLFVAFWLEDLFSFSSTKVFLCLPQAQCMLRNNSITHLLCSALPPLVLPERSIWQGHLIHKLLTSNQALHCCIACHQTSLHLEIEFLFSGAGYCVIFCTALYINEFTQWP